MLYRRSMGAFAMAAALMLTLGSAPAADDTKYPNWKGQWSRRPRLTVLFKCLAPSWRIPRSWAFLPLFSVATTSIKHRKGTVCQP